MIHPHANQKSTGMEGVVFPVIGTPLETSLAPDRYRKQMWVWLQPLAEGTLTTHSFQDDHSWMALGTFSRLAELTQEKEVFINCGRPPDRCWCRVLAKAVNWYLQNRKQENAPTTC